MKHLFRLFVAIALVAAFTVSPVLVVMADDDADIPNFLSQIRQSKEGGLDEITQRYAQTNCYTTYQINGYHLSSTEGQPEEEISVIGRVQQVGYDWADTDSDWQTNAYIALAQTAMANPPGTQNFWAESLHSFHSEGYYDWTPVTGEGETA